MSESVFVADLAECNARHDREHGDLEGYCLSRMRSGWNEAALMRRGELTDKQIAKYEAAGWYSAAFRAERAALQRRKQVARVKREGNFDLVDGRLIYRPQ